MVLKRLYLYKYFYYYLLLLFYVEIPSGNVSWLRGACHVTVKSTCYKDIVIEWKDLHWIVCESLQSEYHLVYNGNEEDRRLLRRWQKLWQKLGNQLSFLANFGFMLVFRLFKMTLFILVFFWPRFGFFMITRAPCSPVWEMAAPGLRACSKCLQNLTANISKFQVQTRYFRLTASLERLKRDYRIKPAPKKRKWVPPTIREDFIFLYDAKSKREFPYHELDLAMKILRLCAIKEENVLLFVRLNLKGKDVRVSFDRTHSETGRPRLRWR